MAFRFDANGVEHRDLGETVVPLWSVNPKQRPHVACTGVVLRGKYRQTLIGSRIRESLIVRIRQAECEDHDRDRVRRLYLAAFPDAEREVVADLATTLLAEVTTPATFALVAESDGDLIGHAGFSPVTRATTTDLVGYILAPLAVHPDVRRRGIGTALIDAGIEAVSSLGGAVVFVYGDPRYYGRFGFDAGIAATFVPPYQLKYEFGWQARVLTADSHCLTPGMLSCVPPLMNPQLW